MSEPWDAIISLLIERDLVEKRDSELIKAFRQFSYLQAEVGHPDNKRLVKENTHLHEETESLMTRLNLQTMKLESANLRMKELEKAVAEKDLKLKKLKSKMGNISDELTEKNKLFELLNDEQLITQIQQNVMRERLAELEKKLENSS